METHIWQIVVVAILFAISAIAKSIQDKLQFHFKNSVFKNVKNPQYWNPAISHKNKWKNGDKAQGEKFFLSSTILVFLTDSWHLFGLIRDFSITLTITIITLNPYYLLIYPIYRGIFHILFTYLLNKK
jgi:hypothetical protein